MDQNMKALKRIIRKLKVVEGELDLLCSRTNLVNPEFYEALAEDHNGVELICEHLIWMEDQTYVHD